MRTLRSSMLCTTVLLLTMPGARVLRAQQSEEITIDQRRSEGAFVNGSADTLVDTIEARIPARVGQAAMGRARTAHPIRAVEGVAEGM